MTLNPEVRNIIDAMAKAEAESQPQAHQMSPKEARQFYFDPRGAVTSEPPQVDLVADI